MTLLSKYILKGFLKIFFIIEIVMIWIFLVVDYLSHMDNFVKAKMSLASGIFFTILKIPFVIVHLTPVSIILTGVIFFGLMNRNKEVIALCSGGIALKKLYLPVIALSIVLSVFVFFMADTIMPFSSAKFNYINLTKIKKKKYITAKSSNIWITDADRIIYIDFYNPDKNEIFNISINFFDGKDIVKHIEADNGFFKNNRWELHNLFIAEKADGGAFFSTDTFSKKLMKFNFNGDDLKEAIKKSDEMGIIELWKYIKSLKLKGYDSLRYEVDFYAKLAFPIACLIMALFGIHTGIDSSSGLKIPFAIVKSLGLAFLYWALYSFSISLGYGGIVYPVVSAFIADILFGIFGITFLILNEKKLLLVAR